MAKKKWVDIDSWFASHDEAEELRKRREAEAEERRKKLQEKEEKEKKN